MKTLFFLLFLSVQVNILSAQVVDNLPWCPSGATWLYKRNQTNPVLNDLYKYEKDTIILNKVVKKIKNYKVGYGINVTPSSNTYTYIPPIFATNHYLYNSNDTIYWYHKDEGKFYSIYRFNMQVGEEFITAPVKSDLPPFSNPSNPCSNPRFLTNDTTKVLGKGPYTVGNKIFYKYFLKDLEKWTMGEYLINNLGPSDLFLPEIYCNGRLTLTLNNLLYYYDDLRGEIEIQACPFGTCRDFISSTETLPQKQIDQDISVYPNPTSGDLLFKGLQSNTSYLVTVYDATGKEILKSMKLSDDEPQLFMGNLINGLYFVKIQNGLQRIYLKFLKN